MNYNDTYILKAKKFVEPLFQSKKIAEKVRKSGRHFWTILGHFWATLDHYRAILGHFGPFWVIFGPLWAILGNFWPFLGHIVAFLKKFAESSNFFAG